MSRPYTCLPSCQTNETPTMILTKPDQPLRRVIGEDDLKAGNSAATVAFSNFIIDAPARRQRCLDVVAAIAAGKFGPAASVSQPTAVPPAVPALSNSGVSQVAQPVGAKTMDAIDFLVDGKSLVGQQVTITECQIHSASTTFVYCGTKAGDIRLDPNTMERESLRRAFKNCTSYPTGPTCFGNVTGTVSKSEVFEIVVLQTSIEWRQ